MANIIRTVKYGGTIKITGCRLKGIYLKDEKLSWKAKGLLSSLLCLREGCWMSFDGPEEIFDELVKYGYLRISMHGNEVEYVVYEKPFIEESSQTPMTDIPYEEDVPEKPTSAKCSEEIERLRENLNLKAMAKECSENFVEMVFKELCRRDAEFCQMMTAKAFELVCLTAWEQQRNKSINELSELINGYLDNVVLGIRSASGGNSPVAQKEMIENSLMYGYHRDK